MQSDHNSMEFTVTFCENCDGGTQEESTAISAIQQVFPDASIKSVCLDEYPIFVKIEVKRKNESPKTIFQSHQRNLFRKYPDLREESIKKIVKACQELKE
ncbi:hypothetical protein C9374_001105 [Naegleria lovaniensis]|uniref:Uncharacterized protein n=1 Tax=Naegleria lovaniensis TaxID=51637 RepID=A0AA88GBV7_NAELO|nr:uncharacterized protein C9374_013156 [Naegleria lovaniensis]XP_044551503.1 uncharacterized protein C9374_001105 [Naegleria lovaniensis]KAG2372792.1 hypothetical protein C9374_013156 [Naegleria lovaniensis]KAG2387511.1 hypothetical protein C9374_001105 [Naegleria lovaniensis]